MSEPLTHAGAVAFHGRDDDVLFLIVSSSDGRHWVLPKGHIDAGETPEECALRELEEEAGVEGELIAPLSTAEFTLPDEMVRVRYFLVRETVTTPAGEGRELIWAGADEALSRLSFDDAREALRKAVAEVAGLDDV